MISCIKRIVGQCGQNHLHFQQLENGMMNSVIQAIITYVKVRLTYCELCILWGDYILTQQIATLCHFTILRVIYMYSWFIVLSLLQD